MAESMVVRELLVVLGVVPKDKAELAAFDKRIETVKGHLGDAADYAGKAKNALGELLGMAAKAAVGVFGLGVGLVYQAQQTSEYALAVERQAAALGMSTDAYQEYRAALGQFGVDQRDVADLFSQIAQQAQMAEGGAQSTVDTFAKLGIKVSDLKGKKPDELLNLIADGLARTEDETTRLAVAGTLLGEDLTKKTLPALMKGAKGLDAYRQKARDAGLVMSKQSIAAAKAFQVSLGFLGEQITGIRNQLGAALVPALTEAVETMSEWITTNRRWISSNIRGFVDRVSYAVRFMTATFIRADKEVKTRLGSWTPVLQLVAGLVLAIGAGFAAFKVGGVIYYGLMATFSLVSAIAAAVGVGLLPAFGILLVLLASVASFAAVALIPWLALGSAIAVVALAIDDVNTFLRGGKSVVGEYLAAFEKSDGILGSSARLLRSLIDLGVTLTPILAGLATQVTDKLTMAFYGLMAILTPVYNMFSRFVGAVTGFMTAQNVAFLDMLTGGVQSLDRRLGGGAPAPAGGMTGFAPPSDMLRGAMAGFAPTTSPPPVAAGAGAGSSVISNDTWNIATTDPVQVVAEVRAITAARMRAAASALSGGDR